MLEADKTLYENTPNLKISIVRNGQVLMDSEEAFHNGEMQLATANIGHTGPYPRLAFRLEYEEGDVILVESDRAGIWLHIRLDDTMDEALVYMSESRFEYKIPFDKQKVGHNPRNFTGDLHLVSARVASEEEAYSKRVLSFNPYDSHENTAVFPHAYANVETRGEAVFAARNAIDGMHANLGHGPWPFQSWGINRDPEAAMTVDFGMPVLLDEIRICLRCDFPHDAYWNQVDIVFDDSIRETLVLEKSDLPQIFRLTSPIECKSVRIEKLIKEEDPSPFPALTQIEYIGVPVKA